MAGQVIKDLKGSFFYDAGYLKRPEELIELAKSGKILCAAPRKNMGRLMSRGQWEHLRRRNMIESGWSVLKQNYFLEYH